MLFSGRLSRRSPLRSWCLGVSIAAGLLFGVEAPARPPASATVVRLVELPAEAQVVHRSIHAGGPFMYPKDGAVFGNRERLLPPQPRGYYREYTVTTPGARDRGARRIVCGGRQPRAPEACFYTADHYTSFHRITP